MGLDLGRNRLIGDVAEQATAPDLAKASLRSVVTASLFDIRFERLLPAGIASRVDVGRDLIGNTDAAAEYNDRTNRYS